MRIYFYFSLLFLSLVSCEFYEGDFIQPDDTATYKVTFVADWTKQSHPTSYPKNAHFSPIFAVAHRYEDYLFSVNDFASEGIKQMAETGATGILEANAENDKKENIDKILSSATGRGIAGGQGTASVVLEANGKHNKISLVSMIAPSPDWFVAIQDVVLYDRNGWFDLIEIEVDAYDAGTDSGDKFTSSDAETIPPSPIGYLTGQPLGNGAEVNPPLGRVIIEKIEQDLD